MNPPQVYMCSPSQTLLPPPSPYHPSGQLMFLNCGAGEDFCESLRHRRSNKSILKEINPEYSLEGLMLKLKLQCIGHLIWRANSLEKTLVLGKIEDRRRRGQYNYVKFKNKIKLEKKIIIYKKKNINSLALSLFYCLWQ